MKTDLPSLKYLFNVSLKLRELLTNTFLWLSRTCTEGGETEVSSYQGYLSTRLILASIFARSLVPRPEKVSFSSFFSGLEMRLLCTHAKSISVKYTCTVTHSTQQATAQQQIICGVCGQRSGHTILMY